MNSRVRSLISLGGHGAVVDIECHLSNNLPNIVIVGFANKAVDEAKERLRGAFANSHLDLPRKRITINLAPADLPKDDSGFDLAMAASILLASHQFKNRLDDNTAVLGEIGLDGIIRPVRGIIGKLLTGRRQGFSTFFIPVGNLAQAQLVPGIELLPVKNLLEFYNHLNEVEKIKAITTGQGIYSSAGQNRPASNEHSIIDIIGQDHAKRALEIAAAGGHNVLFSGPPGTGKSMLAKSLVSILPPLSHEEMLEVTHLHSLAGHNFDEIINVRPFRSPHHSASHVSITGGGHNLRPGEISLSHRGVLFFDELPEFMRSTLEALRQPLEDRTISIARAKDTTEYPANFIFVATANPCPCGYYGTSKPCQCMPHQISRYRNKISGPILDRIDLYAEVHGVEHKKLLHESSANNKLSTIQERINQARQIQLSRYKNQPQKLNSDMNNRDLKTFANLISDAKAILDQAAERLQISPRSYMRTVKIARTIADLADSRSIEVGHITEALQYRGHTYQNS